MNKANNTNPPTGRRTAADAAYFSAEVVHEMMQMAYRAALPPAGSQLRCANQIEAADTILAMEANRAILTAPPAAPVVSDATKWAQGLIEQLPRDHDGRNSWLLNHGIGEESDWLRAEYARHRAAWKEWREGMPQPEMRKYEPALSVPVTDDKGEG